MAEQRGEIVVEVDPISDNPSKETPANSDGKPKGFKIASFHEAVAEAARQSPKSSLRGKALWRLTKSKNFDHFPEESCHSDTDDEDLGDLPCKLQKIEFGKSTLFQCLVLGVILGALALTLTVPGLNRVSISDLPLWKWETLLLALISGRLISTCIVRVGLIFAEHHFRIQKRVLYFTYGLRRAFRNFLWLGLVLLTWHAVFVSEPGKSRNRVSPFVTKILVCLLVASLLWLLKTLVVKILASLFHVNAYFDRIHEALFDQYVIETLSSKPIIEVSRSTRVEEGSRNGSGLSEPLLRKSSETNEEIHKSSISAWYMKKMMHMIQHGSLSTLDEQILESDMENTSHEHIDGDNSVQARKTAKKIFLNVAKPKSRLISVDDLMRFMSKDEAAETIHLFGAKTESGGIDKLALENWVIEAFKGRSALARSLNDTNTAVDDLHNMLNVIIGIVTVVIWLIILGVPITQFLVFISSQLLLLVFVFGNSCKTVFESIIFLFIMHPYDVGDRCEVEGVQLIVEEMNILTTVFLRSDNLKIRYPNNVLATKPISNYNRSPHMGEEIEFCLHISTPMEKIHKMKLDIKEYVESKSEHWHPSPAVIIKNVEDMNKIVVSLWLTHRMNHQDMGQRWVRRALLVEKMIEIFTRHEVEYRMLPLDVNVRNCI